MQVEIKSRKLGKSVVFSARGAAGYVRIGDADRFADQQIFDRAGNAYTAATEQELRTVAKRWISAQSPRIA